MSSGRRIWRRLWRVYPTGLLTVAASPAECLQTISTAARPSQSRLHLRNVFANGRRYYLRPLLEGFELHSDSATFWNRRRRTQRAAIIEGELVPAGDITTVRLYARMRVRYWLLALFMPTWIASIVIYAPWPPALTVVVIVSLYGLALAGTRLEAALQAHEMVFFVRKALEDLPAGNIAELSAQTDVIIDPAQREFPSEWERFYEEMRADSPMVMPEPTPDRTPAPQPDK